MAQCHSCDAQTSSLIAAEPMLRAPSPDARRTNWSVSCVNRNGAKKKLMRGTHRTSQHYIEKNFSSRFYFGFGESSALWLRDTYLAGEMKVVSPPARWLRLFDDDHLFVRRSLASTSIDVGTMPTAFFHNRQGPRLYFLLLPCRTPCVTIRISRTDPGPNSQNLVAVLSHDFQCVLGRPSTSSVPRYSMVRPFFFRGQRPSISVSPLTPSHRHGHAL